MKSFEIKALEFVIVPTINMKETIIIVLKLKCENPTVRYCELKFWFWFGKNSITQWHCETLNLTHKFQAWNRKELVKNNSQ